MKFSPTRTDPRKAILSPDIPDIERTGPVPGPSATNLWEFHFIHYATATKKWLFIVLISFICWCILFHFNQNFSPDRKIIPAPKETTPFPTRPVFLTPDRTDPRFKQNIAPWPESGRGCTVRSGNPRRSGMPRSSLITIICVTHVQKNFQIRASIKQLLTKYQIFTKLPQIPHIN